MIAITGASGQLGRLTIEALLKRLSASEIIALVRDPNKAGDLTARGILVRQADYNRPETLHRALIGVNRLMLISSSEVGQRTAQHRAVIDAAKQEGIELLAYTSLLHADKSVLGLATEHRDTEQALTESGIPHVLLRNGWYHENYTAGIPVALVHGVLLGCAQDGLIASAARADYAEAAAVVLTGENQAGRVYELAGEPAYTLTELAAEVTRQAGKTVVYSNLSESDYRSALISAGLPDGFAALLADSDAGAAKGYLFDSSGDLRKLIGRPTTPMSEAIAAAIGR
uniref:Putative nucleoside-diphosphate-sugar epimerase n=1 Tax=Pseudomonas nitroreducens TaxID=46680 RepID=C3VA37_PSENT|nr:putative nucleoside-diphosphate-sugar epimerase [Pseudomonas nitroreducens]